VSPPSAVSPPSPPAAPAAPKVMVFHHKMDGKQGKDGKKTVVRQLVIKDGKVITDDIKGDGPHMMMLEGGPAEMVKVMETADGKKVMMIRHQEIAEKASKEAQARIAETKARLRARCDSEGIKLPADADFGQLATCGGEIQRKMREAMAAARTAIEKTAGLSAEQRAAALKGIDAAMAGQRHEFVLKMEK
jgi:RNA polymerase-binding transcription factor DksA